MLGAMVMMVTFILGLLMIIFWNRGRVKGKVLGFIVRRDKSVLPKLLELKDDFIIWGTRAYYCYPNYIRICRFPMGWPAFLQELIPSLLIDEECVDPLDWVNLQEVTDQKKRAMNVKAGLDENWLRKLVEESSKESGSGSKFNWKKVLPILLIGAGIIGLFVILVVSKKIKL